MTGCFREGPSTRGFTERQPMSVPLPSLAAMAARLIQLLLLRLDLLMLLRSHCQRLAAVLLSRTHDLPAH